MNKLRYCARCQKPFYSAKKNFRRKYCGRCQGKKDLSAINDPVQQKLI